MSNKNNTVGQLVAGPNNLGKSIMVHPRNGPDFSGKVSSVNDETNSALLKTEDGTKSVAYSTNASVVS